MSRPTRGWVLYDAECPMCRNRMRRVEKIFRSRGFEFAPLRLERNPDARPAEMRVRTADTRVFGGADAVLYLAGFIWWGWPLRWFAKLPGAKKLLHRIYRELASRRSCDNETCLLPEART